MEMPANLTIKRSRTRSGSNPMPILTLSEYDLESLGLSTHPELVVADVKKALIDHGRGTTISDKVALSPSREKMYEKWNASKQLREKYDDEDLDQKLSSLNCFNNTVASVKIVGGSVLNREQNLPRSESVIMLYTSDTIRPISMMRGTEISALRTGAYAAINGEYFMPKETGNIVAYIGSGKIAETSLMCMDATIADRIGELRVYSRTPANRERFVSEMNERTSMQIKASSSTDEAVKGADYVITATTALNPLVTDCQLKKNVVVLLLGGDEVGREFMKRAHDYGMIFCDDWRLVEHRNVQSLPFLYHEAKRGEHSNFRMDESRINDIWKVIDGQIDLRYRNPECVFINCVGLPDLDLKVAQRMYDLAVSRGIGNSITL